MRRSHNTYEYERREHAVYREKIRHKTGLRVLDVFLFILVVPVPASGVALHLLGMPVVPALWLAAYAAVTQTVAGLLFLILTICDVGGFGKVGFFFTHTQGKRWMTTEEAKANTFLFGFIMLVIGVMAILLTIKML